MIICLDGVDGAGKSTFAEAIVKQLEHQFPDDTVIYKHATQIKEDVYTEYAEPFIDYKPGSGVHYVLDRWYLGEEIYGPLYRGKSAFDTVSFRWIDLFLASKGFRLWNVTNELDVIKSRLNSRGEDFLQLKDISFVYQEYLNLAPHLSTFAKHITPVTKDYDDLIRIIINDAFYAEERARLFETLGINFFGNVFLNPRTVLVVENTKKNKNFDPRVNEDARLILNALPGDGDFWQTFAVISSASLDKLDELLKTFFLDSSNVVAYGDTVKARLKTIGVVFGEIPKPNTSDRYGSQIRSISIESGKL